MSDVFISYKREDQERVQRLYDALAKAGLSVWWDLDTEGGAAWRQRIERELASARCVVVVWSRESVGERGTFVHDEATRALARRVLLPVRIDGVTPPLGFGEHQALDLVGWHGSEKDLRFQDVLARVRAILEGKAPPRPQWPARRRRAVALSATGATFVAALVAALLLPPLQRALCRLPGVCRLCESPEDCYQWVDREFERPLTMRGDQTSFPSEQEAKASILRQAPDDARLACGPADGRAMRNLAASPRITRWICSPFGDGYRCSADGVALCKQQQKVRAPACKCAR